MKHVLHTMKLNKISLTPFDDKRYLHDDGITSYAYGHHLIKEAEENLNMLCRLIEDDDDDVPPSSC